MKSRHKNQFHTLRRAFTLTEILVVLGIIAFVSALTLGAFKSYSDGQKRTNCSANLAQIYRAARLYSNDFGAFPAYDGTNNTAGLWALWASPNRTGTAIPSGLLPPSVSALSTGMYLRSAGALHCPSDGEGDALYSETTYTLAGDATVRADINRRYASYQVAETDGEQPYLPSRFVLPNSVTENDVKTFTRQLHHFRSTSGGEKWIELRPSDSTVVTWCRFHRGLSTRGDNVLFYDGAVRRLPQFQNECSPDKRWLRAPNGCDPNGLPK